MFKIRRISAVTTLLMAGTWTTLPRQAQADPDDCVADPVDPTTAVCSGNQSEGIASGDDFNSPALPGPFSTLEVDALTVPIAPTAGTEGIDFRRTAAGDVNVDVGTAGGGISINVNGADGIYAESQGTPPAAPPDPFLGIPIPGAPAVSGGVVDVDNYANISTSGANADGIAVLSRTTSYPASVTTALTNFSATDFSFTVASVDDPSTGMPVAPGTTVQGELYELVDLDGDGVLDENPIAGDGGTFMLNADGTFTLDRSTMAALAPGQQVFTRVRYTVDGVEVANTSNMASASGELSVLITGPALSDPPLPPTYTEADAVYQASFMDGLNDTWGTSSRDLTTPTAALPNLESYIAELLSQTQAGGAGNSVTVTNNGAIVTTGVRAHGINARSQGANGGNGRDASIGNSSTRGGPGNDGGNAAVVADGSIATAGNDAFGVLARSVGGVGGQGGDSGWSRNSKRGGTGGDGGLAEVSGNGVIVTSGDRAYGIYALSEGGNGGGGGSGSTFNSADDGGGGGAGGTIEVGGDWNISTIGNEARGIWARSTGGKAGGGGDGGWTGTSAGAGGQATGGGSVTVDSGGSIVTGGNDAHGIYAQSVGGFGGDGGSGTSIFFAAGGDGSSAGSGGYVEVTNRGTIITGANSTNTPGARDPLSGTGQRSHGIFAQSVGGGGGSGGDGLALVGFGGGSASGGHGGDVEVANAASGTIRTFGVNARGVYAQSVGGGGGDGGDSGGLVAIGGQGSRTSAGGTVEVTNDGTIDTQGRVSDAVFAQSIGGAGGDGGSSSGLVSIGGSGGGGGNADTVDVTNTGQITTSGDDSRGVFAQSVGGGGGNGGDSIAFGVVGSVAIGGDGAAGGDGAQVTVTNDGAIDTAGNRSRGIFAQSVGGGGGNGGYAVSAAKGPISVAVGSGGAGAGGGAGRDVTVASTNAISTEGRNAQGIFAQSLGGSGGSGGFSFAAGASEFLSASIALGGTGGAGGSAGVVEVTNSGAITTGRETGIPVEELENVDSGVAALLRGAGYSTVLDVALATEADLAAISGIDGSPSARVRDVFSSIFSGSTLDTLVLGFDQLLGVRNLSDLQGLTRQDLLGAGFNDATADLVFEQTRLYSQTVPVWLLNQAQLTSTMGSYSPGIEAVSQGGGGGSGGFSLAASGSLGFAGSFAFGGDGGIGGNGQAVGVTNDGIIVTRSNHSHGIFGQSLGGGGGNGGFSIAGALSGGGALGISIGGGGGAAGTGALVDITNGGDIATFGELSHGIFGQSLGGGGGNGGFSIAASAAVPFQPVSGTFSLSIGGTGGAGNEGGEVKINNTGRIDTFRQGSYGILALSQGGGGGKGGFAGSFAGFGQTANIGMALGGAGGNGSNSDNVTVVNAGTIATRGDNAYGVFAKSLGGGGGDAGFGLSFAGGSGSFINAGNYSVAVGGEGGDAGFAGTVDVENTGAIGTLGSRSDAIYARSLGGGGGDGGFSSAGTLVAGGTNTAPQVAVSVGGAGGDGGYAGDVTVVNSGALMTVGEKSSGIDATSEGGGGGDGGISFAASLALAPAGTGLPVNVGVAVGGGAGNGNTGGDVTIRNCVTRLVGDDQVCDSQGDNSEVGIFTNDVDSSGIRARSLGGGGGDGGAAIAVGADSSGRQSTNSLNVNVAVGGSGGVGNSAGSVAVDNRGIIVTGDPNAVDLDASRDSHGIFARSQGGGGGDGGASVAAGLSAGNMATGSSISAQVSVGRGGGMGGLGGAVDVANFGGIETYGNSSRGIWAQSLGGGGGNGGFSAAGSVLVGGQSTAPRVSVAVGGSGGDGNWADAVLVTNDGTIATAGQESSGILAESIGGSGGHGGASLAGTLSFAPAATGKSSINASVAVGGGGGDGNPGGPVTVRNCITQVVNDERVCDPNSDTSGLGIFTNNVESHGIFAESLGGGGGNGGASFAVGFGRGGDVDTRNVNVSVAVGGFAGDGNYADTVTVENWSNIVTGDPNSSDPGASRDSHGIWAQSTGGGGGNGGASFAGNFASGSATKGSTIVTQLSVGGFGGDGNHGGLVDIDNFGNIETFGNSSQGIWAQSIGGGGGNGGNSRSVHLVADKTLYFNPLPDTPADNNIGISVSVGGFGGGSSNGNVVDVTNEGSITTHGALSRGIWAQSIGGGGGDGGAGIRGTDTFLNTATIVSQVGFFKDWQATVGGNAGSSGDGSTVLVDNTGAITTFGLLSHAIFAQSIGGGGGNAEFYAEAEGLPGSITGDREVPSDGYLLDLRRALGRVHVRGHLPTPAFTLTNPWAPRTKILPSAGSLSERVSAVNTALASAGPDRKLRADAEHLPGGIELVLAPFSRISVPIGFPQTVQFGVRLAGGAPVPVMIEGDPTNMSVADLVVDLNAALRDAGLQGATLDDPATLVTADASGGHIVLSAINGADEIQLVGIENLGALGLNPAPNGPRGGRAVTGFTGKINIGGGAGSAGNGGAVTVEHTGDIETWGTGAYGVNAQSIGGGGGVGGNIIRSLPEGIAVPGSLPGGGTKVVPELNIGILPAFGQPVRGGGDGQAVTVSTSGDITTHGDDAHGIFAQSVGGGGGVAGGDGVDVLTTPKVGLIGSVGGAGNAGNVIVNHEGSITTEGFRSHGIFAQSAGGQGLGGDVDITLGDPQDPSSAPPISITASGADSDGILVQSRGENGVGVGGAASNGDITVTIAANATVAGGTGDGVGVRFMDGLNNALSNHGRITTGNGLGGFAVAGDVGTETIYNYGIIEGSIDLDLASADPLYTKSSSAIQKTSFGPSFSPNFFSNEADAIFSAGSFVNLGGGTLTNAGTLLPGGQSGFATTSINGDLVQTDTGVIGVDVSVNSNQADLIDVTGTATLEGELVVTTLDAITITPGTRAVTFLDAAGGVVDNDLTLVHQPSAVLGYTLKSSGSGDVGLEIGVDFSSPSSSLSGNHKALGSYINNVQAAGGSEDLQPLIGTIVAAPDAAALEGVYEGLTPDIVADTQLITLYSSRLFADAMLDCAMRGDGVNFERERQCTWMHMGLRDVERNETAASNGFKETTFQVAGGAQYDLGNRWILGGALSYENRDLQQIGHSANSDGYQVQGGLVAKWGLGRLSFSGSLSGGYASLDASRLVGPERDSASSEQTLTFLSSRLRADYTVQNEDRYFKSSFDLGVDRVALDGYEERGPSSLNLHLDDSEESYFSTRIGFELGNDTMLRSGTVLRPNVSVGYTSFWNDPGSDVRARFQAAPAGSGWFVVGSEMDDNYVDLGFGLDVVSPSGMIVRFSGHRQMADNFEGSSANLEISFAF